MLNDVQIHYAKNGDMIVIGSDAFIGKYFQQHNIVASSVNVMQNKIDNGYIVPQELKEETLAFIRRLPKESCALNINSLWYVTNMANRHGAQIGDVYIERLGKDGRESKCFQVTAVTYGTISLREINCNIIRKADGKYEVIPAPDEWAYNDRVISTPNGKMRKWGE